MSAKAADLALVHGRDRDLTIADLLAICFAWFKDTGLQHRNIDCLDICSGYVGQVLSFGMGGGGGGGQRERLAGLRMGLGRIAPEVHGNGREE